MKTIDLLYVGPLETSTWSEVQVLLDIGKAPLGWIGEFTPAFLLPFADFSPFPAGIAMYAETLTEERLRSIIPQSRFILELASNAAFLASPEIRSFLSAYPEIQILQRAAFETVDDLIRVVLPKPVTTTARLEELTQKLGQDFANANFEAVHETLTKHRELFPRAEELLQQLETLRKGRA